MATKLVNVDKLSRFSKYDADENQQGKIFNLNTFLLIIKRFLEKSIPY